MARRNTDALPVFADFEVPLNVNSRRSNSIGLQGYWRNEGLSTPHIRMTLKEPSYMT